MRRPWLLLDANYLAYRSFYAMGHLSFNDTPTGVLFGFIRELKQLLEQFQTDRVAFCFDRGVPLRKAHFAGYKARRDEKSEEEKAKIQQVRNQCSLLRKEYLPSLGYQNILSQNGYEADDIIASVCRSRTMSDLVVVSSDQDLYQLLTPRVSVWNPAKKELITKESFTDFYGVTPEAWKDVKALAGCQSDCVPGVKGVGEATAVKFLTGQLKQGVKFEAIIKANALWRRNLMLVSLPYGGVNTFDLVKDDVSESSWREFIDRFGFKSLREFIPGATSKPKKMLTRKTL